MDFVEIWDPLSIGIWKILYNKIVVDCFRIYLKRLAAKCGYAHILNFGPYKGVAPPYEPLQMGLTPNSYRD
jgi:hypothetical protein